MSDTDDTDILLLIPPNFFLVHSSGSEDSLLDSSRTVVHKPPSCTSQVLGKLVNQVHSLESRLGCLELSSSDTLSSKTGLTSRRPWECNQSIDCGTLNRKYSTFPRRRRRKIPTKHNNELDFSLRSIDSPAFNKTVPPLSLHSRCVSDSHTPESTYDTISMDGDISSIVSTPSKKNDKLLLHEIDEFLTKVESYELPENRTTSQDLNISSDNVIQATTQYMRQRIDDKDGDIKLPSERVVSNTMLDKYIYLANSETPTSESNKQPESSNYRTLQTNDTSKYPQFTKLSDTSKSLPEAKSPAACKLNFSEKDFQPTSTPKRPLASTSNSFKPTSNKIYEKASKVLEQYKQNNSQPSTVNTSYLTSSKKEDFKYPRCHNVEYKGHKLNLLQNKLIDTIDTDLLSLSEMWGDRKEGPDKVDSIKLEEERMKREHCETLIQELQKKLLEQQERLAVAVKVDRSKDVAIMKLRDAWMRLTSGLDKTEERHKAELNKMCREVEGYRNAAEEAQKRTQHFETELYKALDFAHDYQEKCKKLKAENSELQISRDKMIANKEDTIKNKEQEIEVLKENYDTVMRMNRQSTDCVRNVEEALEKEKSDHIQTKSQLKELAEKIQKIQEENCLVKQEREQMKEKVNEERARCNMCERQLAEKQNQNSELFKKCDILDNEVKSLHNQLECQKNELKVHYQSQLEQAVLAKLAEFQTQLEQAEREMESESRTKENAIVDAFSKQMERIEEQHKLEVKVLEEKHKEEIKLYRLQMAQCNEKIGLLESKVCEYRSRRSHMAQQLHGVMQTQWKHALQILTRPGTNNHITAPSPSVEEFKVPSLSLPARRRRAPPRDIDLDSLSDHELQHYVKLLLTKPADLTDDSLGVDQSKDDLQKDINEEPTSDRADKGKGKRNINLSKPPWKS